MVAKASAFRHFVETEYKLSFWASQQHDGARRRPQVTPAVIFRAGLYQAVLGLSSLLRVDQWLRTAVGKRLVDSHRPSGGSDTTLLRALSAWDREPLRQASYALHLLLRDRGWGQRSLSSGRTVRLAIVDGSNFGGVWASVLGFAGRFYHMVDLQRYEGNGHELTGSRQLLERATARLGEGFATHLLYDGLMADRPDFAAARRHWGLHLVVKTTEEESLQLIADTRALWSQTAAARLSRLGVEVVSGTDRERAVSYQVYAQGGQHWEGLPFALKLAWVRETHLKGKYRGQTFAFWVITTDESLTAAELRELAHLRWAIENNGFKRTNAAVGSKRAYLKDGAAKEALLLLWGIGLALEQAFALWLQDQEAWRSWGVKKTAALISQCILLSGLDDELSGCGGSP